MPSDLDRFKFSFRKEKKATGLASIASSNQSTVIRLNGFTVGMIAAPNRFARDEENWSLRFMVKRTPDEENPSGWAWVDLTKKFPLRNPEVQGWDGEAAMRDWIRANEAAIKAKLDLATNGKDEGDY